ncbi:chaperonin GroEL-like [Bactrocera neohumeralis]|uniref:chaperonin GroEL-like n=1 Tax=Bactrocera neohumeralis TaxID=98809 RepID=UPI0021662D65|nr:chaperonin GroEL-like [Bactrocera neohumeralis]
MTANFLEQSYTGRAETRNLVDEVVDAAFESVVSTMGPNSELALIIEKNKPVVTKDGVRVAKALDFNEIRKNMIASLITSAAIKTDELVGDGTTTTVFMVNKLYNKFKEHLNFTSTRYLDKLVRLTVEHLRSMEDIASRVIQLFRDYKTPKIQLRRGMGHPEDVIEVQSDIVFEGRYASPHLQPGTPRGVFTVNNPSVLLLDGQVTSLTSGHANAILNSLVVKVMRPIERKEGESPDEPERFEEIIEEGSPVIIFGRFFEPDVLNTLIGLNTHVNRLLKNPENAQKLYIIPFSLNVAGTAGGNVIKDLGRMIGTDIFSNFPDAETLEWQLKRKVESVNLNMLGVSFDASTDYYVTGNY